MRPIFVLAGDFDGARQITLGGHFLDVGANAFQRARQNAGQPPGDQPAHKKLARPISID